MVLLTVTPAGQSAIHDFLNLKAAGAFVAPSSLAGLSTVNIDTPIEHETLINLSRLLITYANNHSSVAKAQSQRWRLDKLLRGAKVYKAPPPPKPEPTPEFKALMQRLREEEEQRQYDRMIASASNHDSHGRPSKHADHFVPSLSHGQADPIDLDELTYADVNRQVILIINVLVSIVACSVAIWIGARHWKVPQRLALSMTGSIVVAVAEVAIYLGYLRRIKESKELESKKIEKKEIVDSWVINSSASAKAVGKTGNVRFRKGKHR